MTEEELNRLEALAKAATSGPWARHHDPEAYAVYQPEFQCWIPQDGNDADFIAASNPNAILSLIRLARIGLAVTPRPIAEAPRDETILGFDGPSRPWLMIYDEERDAWLHFSTHLRIRTSHFIPLTSLPKPGGE